MNGNAVQVVRTANRACPRGPLYGRGGLAGARGPGRRRCRWWRRYPRPIEPAEDPHGSGGPAGVRGPCTSEVPPCRRCAAHRACPRDPTAVVPGLEHEDHADVEGRVLQALRGQSSTTRGDFHGRHGWPIWSMSRTGASEGAAVEALRGQSRPARGDPHAAVAARLARRTGTSEVPPLEVLRCGNRTLPEGPTPAVVAHQGSTRTGGVRMAASCRSSKSGQSNLPKRDPHGRGGPSGGTRTRTSAAWLRPLRRA